jgi:hypothetical protein
MLKFIGHSWNAVENTMGRVYDWSMGWGTDIDEPINLSEVNALIRYASENGIDPPGPDPKKSEETTLKLLNDAVLRYRQRKADPSGEAPPADEGNIESTIIYHYARLTQHTRVDGHMIHGRTLIDTRNSGRALFMLMVTTLILTVLAITNEVFVSWAADTTIPVAGKAFVHFFTEHILKHLMPFVWGALGGCIYLSMRLYNIARHRAFDRSKYHGWMLRVLLASIIGAVTFYIIEPTKLTSNGVPIEAKTLAFLSGLGVKVVYGAFEKLVDTIVEKFNLDSLRRAPTDKAKLLEQYALQLTDPKVADNPKKRDAVLEMIRDLGKSA